MVIGKQREAKRQKLINQDCCLGIGIKEKLRKNNIILEYIMHKIKSKSFWNLPILCLMFLFILSGVFAALNDAVLYLSFNSNCINDASTYATNAQSLGASHSTTTSFMGGGSCEFTPASTPRINISKSLTHFVTAGTGFTVTFWDKRKAVSAYMGSYAMGGGVDRLYSMYYSTNKIDDFISQESDGTINTVIPATTYTDTANWHFHLLYIDSDGKIQKSYYDNTSRGTAVSNSVRYNTYKTAYIGTEFSTEVAGDWFNGFIDEFAIWKRNLTDAERLQLSGGFNPYDVVTNTPTIKYNSSAPVLIGLNTSVSVLNNFTFGISSVDAILTYKFYYSVNSTTNRYARYINGTGLIGFFNDYVLMQNTSSKLIYSLDDNEIFRGTYAINPDLMENTSHLNTVLNNANDCGIMQFTNISTNEPDGIFELMINSSSLTGANGIYYCNSSYTTGKLSTSPYCVNFYNLPASKNFYHSHSVNSKHRVVPFPVMNKTIGGIGVSPVSYFAVCGNIASDLGYISNIAYIGQSRLTANGGTSYSALSGTIDAHVHQITNTTLFMYACINDTTGDNACSTLTSFPIGYDFFPPTSPGVYSPVSGFYRDFVAINYTACESSTAPIVFYNISLLDGLGAYHSVVKSNNSLALSFLFNSSVVADGSYYVRVDCFDSKLASSYGVSELFDIQNNCAPDYQNMTIYDSGCIPALLTQFKTYLFYPLNTSCVFYSNYTLNTSTSCVPSTPSTNLTGIEDLLRESNIYQSGINDSLKGVSEGVIMLFLGFVFLSLTLVGYQHANVGLMILSNILYSLFGAYLIVRYALISGNIDYVLSGIGLVFLVSGAIIFIKQVTMIQSSAKE